MKFSADWFTHNVPVWREHVLPALPQAPRVLEIGSYEGRSAAWMLDNIPGVRLTCVDPFFEGNEPAFDANVGGRVEKVASRSFPFLLSAARERRLWDMVYIDGDHEAKAVLEDFVLSWHCLPIGGLCIFDDYPWTFRDIPGRLGQKGPAPAVDACLGIYADRLAVVHRGYQVIVRKADDHWQISSTESGRT
jgi:hypothetical protein